MATKIDLSQLTTLTTAAAALSSLVAVTPQTTVGYQPQPNLDLGPPPSAPSPAFLFNYEGEQTVSLESDITDHYVEDNIAVQDNIALKPVIITTHGFIGELNDIPPAPLAALKTVAAKLTTIDSYVPGISETASLAYSEAFFLYQTAQSVAHAAVSAWNNLGGNGGVSFVDSEGVLNTIANQTQQANAFQQFYGYWALRTLFTVQTPWAIFTNMAISKLRAIQDAETNVITDFELSFKGIRKSSTLIVGAEVKQVAERAIAQTASLVDLGTSLALASTALTVALSQVSQAA